MSRKIATALSVLMFLGAFATLAKAQHFSDWSAPVNLGPVVNTVSSDGGPFITKNGRSLYFASNRSGSYGGQDIWVAQRESTQDPWGPPVNLGGTINSLANEHCPLVTPDGHALIFVSDRVRGTAGADFYISFRHDTDDDLAWGPPQIIAALNIGSDQMGPSVFENEDGEGETLTLYFQSKGAGGPGGYDIYVSTIGEDWSFSAPVLVPELSTTANDMWPTVRKDGRELFLTSNRPGSMAGGADLWVSTRESTDDPWSTPVNLGPVVNSTAAEQRATLSWNATTLIFATARSGGSGGVDLWQTTRTKLHGYEK